MKWLGARRTARADTLSLHIDTSLHSTPHRHVVTRRSARTHSASDTESRGMADYSDDQLDKRVVAQSGVEIGSVEEVRDGDLYVAVEPDADDDAVAQLGWDGMVNQDVHHLEDQYVSNVTDTTIRLRV